MAHQTTPSSQKALMMELKSLQEQPVEGFRITLVEESDLYNWEVAIFGPPNTLYEGGYFKAHIKFPIDYPYSPPTFRFLTKIMGTFAYPSCTLLWTTLRVENCLQKDGIPLRTTILLSVISLLNEPNTFSPANVDASVMFRKWRDSKGKDKEYAEIIRKQVLSTAAEAERDGVKVPTTLAEYCVQTRVPSQDSSSDLLYDDLYDDDMEEEDEDEDESEMESGGEASTTGGSGTSTRRYDNQDDSGNEDS
ncbi:hypothetical protein CRUP_012249 [Coryphaenoides rupestris]|nr:hypothetical protein CRUP_012249 [Coryphaenoides rupestris]